MTLSCSCGARLKIADEKLTDAGVRIKCPRCGTVHLAKRQQPAAPSMPWFAAATPAASGGSPLVLIAHDSKVVADMIDGVLKEGGFVTDYAPNGLEALRKASELKPVAMVVDVGLTGIYGFELCERLKGDPGTRSIKIVLLSSVYGLTAYKRAPVQLYGADDYIEKHHIPDQLLGKVQRLASGSSGAPPSAPPAPAVRSEDQPAGALPPPLVSRKGVVQPAGEGAARAVAPVMPQAVPEEPSVLPRSPVTLDTPLKRVEPPAAPPAPAGPSLQPSIAEEPSILPKTPVTLDASRKRAEPPGPAVPPKAPLLPDEPSILPKTPVTLARSPQPAMSPAAPAPVQSASAPPPAPKAPAAPPADASVKLDADFFEQEEYEAPARPATAASADPAEIERARRFARIIVSDIALYNQEAVTEGVTKGTFYELLKDDITEGRSVYETRVPEDIRRTGDYLQEAFDDFLAAKKKLR